MLGETITKTTIYYMLSIINEINVRVMHSNPKDPAFTRFCTDVAVFNMILGQKKVMNVP